MCFVVLTIVIQSQNFPSYLQGELAWHDVNKEGQARAYLRNGPLTWPCALGQVTYISCSGKWGDTGFGVCLLLSKVLHTNLRLF